MYKILDTIDSPADLRKLDLEGLRTLCAEIRDYMVRCCAENPGHLGSSLGSVELIVAPEAVGFVVQPLVAVVTPEPLALAR